MSDNLNQTLNIESENKSDDSINEQNISKFLEKIEGTIKQKEPEIVTSQEIVEEQTNRPPIARKYTITSNSSQ